MSHALAKLACELLSKLCTFHVKRYLGSLYNKILLHYRLIYDLKKKNRLRHCHSAVLIFNFVPKTCSKDLVNENINITTSD